MVQEDVQMLVLQELLLLMRCHQQVLPILQEQRQLPVQFLLLVLQQQEVLVIHGLMVQPLLEQPIV